MQPIFPNFAKAKVLVVGDIMLDRYWHGAAKRISPEAPVPIIKVTEQIDKPGGGANVALNIAALGAQVTLIGAVGFDEAATKLTTILHSARVNTEFVAIDAPTIIKLRALSQHQQLLRLDFEQSLANAAHKVTAKVAQILPDFDVLLLSDYGKGTLSHQELIGLAKKMQKPVFADPKGDDFSLYQGATLITPNLSEFEHIVGKCFDENDLVQKGLTLIKSLQMQALLITRSENGMTLLRPNLPPLHLPTKAAEVFDVTGAGDTVIATLAAAVAAGDDLTNAAMLANLAASIAVSKLGAVAVSAPELRRKVLQNKASERGVLSLEQLLPLIDEARQKGEQIIFTNGCFDILHAGHVAYLEQARQLGQRLIVAVNSDESVRKLKGQGRPINNLERRMAVLAGLEAVDWVLSFSADTPYDLIAQIKPDILVKGGDYQINEIVGADLVLKGGGKVMALDLVANSSTSLIVDKIKQQQS